MILRTSIILLGVSNTLHAAVISAGGANNQACLDIVDGKSATGTPIQVWSCNTNPQQDWQYVSGTLQSLGKCLQVVNQTPENGAKLEIATCTGASVQQWIRSGNTWVYANTYCLDLTDGNGNNGVRPQIWTCYAGNANQVWNHG